MYNALVRGLAPMPSGKFCIPSRVEMNAGYGFIVVDLTRSGKLNFGDVDSKWLKTSSTVSIRTRHTKALGDEIAYHAIFVSSGTVDISGDTVQVELL